MLHSHPMKSRRVVITCGPSYEPIDQVRRITNHSTGKLGIQLANLLTSEHWEVCCCKGVGATHPEPLLLGVERIPFTTNDHLRERLEAIPDREEVVAVFHAAALSDYRVRRGGAGLPTKLESRAGNITLQLEPVPKLIGELRRLFPRSRLVGWKYELEGTQADMLIKGRLQLDENASDVCVLNGSAYGPGFGVLERGGHMVHLDSYAHLCEWLARWLAK